MSRALLVLLLAATFAAASAQAQTYPAKAIRLIVPTSPGALLDLVSRLIGAKITELTGQTVVVENRPGASNNLGTELVARAAPDGYTLLNVTLPFVANPSLFANLPYNVERDFAPVSHLVSSPYVLVVHPAVPAKSVKELVALAKAKPNALNYASGGSGTNFHMALELFKQQTRTQIVHIPYKGGGPAFAAVVAGEADLTVPSVAQAMPQVRAGRIRPLAVTGAHRAALLPEVPTVIEAGVPGYTFTSWVGMLVPAATAPVTISTLNALVVKAMRSNDVVQKLAADGTDVVAGSPEQFRAHLKSELSRWAAVVKSAGLKVE